MDNELSRTVDALPGLVWTAFPDGRIEFVNRRWCEYTGLSVEQAAGEGWQTAFHPDDRRALLEAWQTVVASGERGEAEARMRRFDGTYRWFLCRTSPIADVAGEIVKWCGINSDIDDRKRAEALRAELAHLSCVNSLGVLTALIAHEINQPLAGIVTNASTSLRMLSAEPPNVEGALETVRRTIRDGHRASEVMTRLRALFSKKA